MLSKTDAADFSKFLRKRPLPKNTVRTSFICTESEHANLQAWAKLRGVTMGAIIQEAIRQKLVDAGLQPDKMPRFETEISYDE